jgi:hypothetical protein
MRHWPVVGRALVKILQVSGGFSTPSAVAT